MSIEIVEVTSKRKGIASHLQLVCKACNANTSFMSSKKCNNGYYENNLRLVYGLRSIGKGCAAARTLSSVMNLPPPPLKFSLYNDVILKAVKDTADESMATARREAIDENDGNNDIAAIFDGTWQKRGYTSINGVVTVSSLGTGKIMDVECLSKYCNKCLGKNTLNHNKCIANYKGTSGGMEITGVEKIYERSNTDINPA